MADDTFSSIAAGYGGAQSTMVRLGLLPGSFAPVDQGGNTAVQLPTPPPPIFTTQLTHSAPFPAMTPGLAGAAAPPSPRALSPLPTNLRMGNPSAFVNAPNVASSFTTAAAPPSPASMGMGGGYGQGASMGITRPAWGMPIAPPPWAQAFTNPLQGHVGTPNVFAQGSMLGDMAMSGYAGTALRPPPATGMSLFEQRASAARRMSGRIESGVLTALDVGSTVAGFGGAMAGLGMGSLGGALGLAAAPLAAMSMWGGAYSEQRQGQRSVEDIFSNMRIGGLTGATGRGMDPRAAAKVFQTLDKDALNSRDFSTQDYMSHMGMGEQMGLMRGHTGSTDQIVGRVKELARATKAIMDLGENLTQGDAMELQAITRQMGVSGSRFRSQNMGTKLVSAARAAGMTLQGFIGGVGSEGASAFQQMGLNAGNGMMMAGMASTAVTGMVDQGLISDRRLAQLGGQSGFTTNLIRGIGAATARNAGSMMLGALNDDMTFDSGAFQRMSFGTMNMENAQKRGRKTLKGTGLSRRQKELRAAVFSETASDAFAEYQESTTPELQMSSAFRQATQMMEDAKLDGRGMTGLQALTRVTGSGDRAQAMMELAKNPSALRANRQQLALSRRERRQRLKDEHDVYTGFWETWKAKGERGASALKDITGVRAAAMAAAGMDSKIVAKSMGVSEGRLATTGGGGMVSDEWRDKLRRGEGLDDVLAGLKKGRGVQYGFDEDLQGRLEDMGFQAFDPRMAAAGALLGQTGGATAGGTMNQNIADAQSVRGAFQAMKRFDKSPEAMKSYLSNLNFTKNGVSTAVSGAGLAAMRAQVNEALDHSMSGQKGATALLGQRTLRNRAREVMLQKEAISSNRSVAAVKADKRFMAGMEKVLQESDRIVGSVFTQKKKHPTKRKAYTRAIEGDIDTEMKGLDESLKVMRMAHGVKSASDSDAAAFGEGSTEAMHVAGRALVGIAEEHGFSGDEDYRLLMESEGDADKLQEIAESTSDGYTRTRALKIQEVLRSKKGEALSDAVRQVQLNSTLEGKVEDLPEDADAQIDEGGSSWRKRLSTEDMVAALGATRGNMAMEGQAEEVMNALSHLGATENILDFEGIAGRARGAKGKKYGSNEDYLTHLLGNESLAASKIVKATGANDALSRLQDLSAGGISADGKSQAQIEKEMKGIVASLIGGVVADAKDAIEDEDEGGDTGPRELEGASADFMKLAGETLTEAKAAVKNNTKTMGSLKVVIESLTTWLRGKFP